MIYKTEQEDFWAGEFGNQYIKRNIGDELLASNLSFFVHALKSTSKTATAIEFGANIGMNLKAIKLLQPSIVLEAIEINQQAAAILAESLPETKIHNTSILSYQPDKQFDLVLIKGVLIHLNPEELPETYDKLAASVGKYLLIAEYYNPVPVAIPYRGHVDRLFKRDFCGEILDRHPEFRLLDYGFCYRRDPQYPQDDITWFLLGR
jgi:spore coat polysaccharide biosynthesis protein SpsF